MLKLNRTKNQKIRIGDDIILTVVSVRGRQVSIGITAPDEVRIVRPEAHKKYPNHARDKAGSHQQTANERTNKTRNTPTDS